MLIAAPMLHCSVTMSEQLETKWRAVAMAVKSTIPDNADEDYDLRELYQKSGETQRGCTPVYNNEFVWQCKMYIGGKQRVLGVGSCFQCATLYDAAYWRFQQYRTRKFSFGKIYNFSEQQAAANNTNADFLTILGQFEDLLKSHNLLQSPEQRAELAKLRKADARHSRYTTAGQLKYTQDLILERIEAISLEFEKINRRLDELSTRKAPGDIVFVPHNIGNPFPTGPLPLPPNIIPGSPAAPFVGPGYTAPVIGDAPTITCQNPNHSSGGILITPKQAAEHSPFSDEVL